MYSMVCRLCLSSLNNKGSSNIWNLSLQKFEFNGQGFVIIVNYNYIVKIKQGRIWTIVYPNGLIESKFYLISDLDLVDPNISTTILNIALVLLLCQ